MGVNSASKGFVNKQLVVGSTFAIVLLAILFITSSFTTSSNRHVLAKQVNVLIRQIGHRLLLQSGDWTSRVLPVTEIREGTFLLAFENEFVFSHDSLMMMSRELFPKTQFPSGYTVTVHDCVNANIVYGFQVNNTSPDILACRGRHQPAGCYTIEFAFPDFYENVEQKKAEIDQPTEESKSVIVGKEANPIPLIAIGAIGTEESKTTTIGDDVDQATEELKSFEVDPLEANPKQEEFKTTSFNFPLINLVWSGLLVLFSVALLNKRFGKSLTLEAVQNQNHPTSKESVQELAALGKFLFDVKSQRLLPTAPIAIGGIRTEVINLTDKECKILELLNKNFGELITRDTLMQEVWINEGVITGRSLDMFVSKLRKKLSSDPELSITNVHGKGYKLEVHGI